VLIVSAAKADPVIVTASAAPIAIASAAGLNLNSPVGLATLKTRVKAAAAELCLANGVEPLDTRLARARCYRSAVADGYRQLDRMTAPKTAASMGASAGILSNAGR
jgi:UrcA family protein